MAKNADEDLFSTASDEYRLGEQIGSGGSGRVFEATTSDGSTVAIKLLNPDFTSDQKRRRFRKEIRYCSEERHPAILRIIDSGAATDKYKRAPFYVMPRYHSTAKHVMSQRLSGDAAMKFVVPILGGLAVAHNAGVYHRRRVKQSE